ncbi:hypothetical protein RI367_000735 [Sorochytrium milnesiophthora]
MDGQASQNLSPSSPSAKAGQNKANIFAPGWKEKDFGNATYNNWRAAMILMLEDKPDYNMAVPELLMYFTSNNLLPTSDSGKRPSA